MLPQLTRISLNEIPSDINYIIERQAPVYAKEKEDRIRERCDEKGLSYSIGSIKVTIDQHGIELWYHTDGFRETPLICLAPLEVGYNSDDYLKLCVTVVWKQRELSIKMHHHDNNI